MDDKEISGLFERAANGEFGGMHAKDGASARGPRGECLLHWTLFHGDWASSLEWLRLGLPMPDDTAGNSPLHWWAMGSKRGIIELAEGMDQGSRVLLIDALSAMASRLDAFGRDPLGLACHGLHAREIASFIGAFPEAARLGARLGPGIDLSLADALLSRGIYTTNELGEAMWTAGVAPPSLDMPACLAASGVWDQPLWEQALSGAAHPRQRAAAEALAIAKASQEGFNQALAARL